MKRLRLAVIGIGKIARDQHLPAIAANPAFALVATASLSGDVPGVPPFPRLQAVLDNGPEVIPANREAPIAAQVLLRHDGAPVEMALDFLAMDDHHLILLVPERRPTARSSPNGVSNTEIILSGMRHVMGTGRPWSRLASPLTARR